MRNRDRVAALIIKDKKLLLVTGQDTGYYWTPGGKIDKDEDHEQALRREIREELGIEIDILGYYTQLEFINPKNNQPQTSYYYLATMMGEPAPSQEISDYKFFNATELLKVTHFMNDTNMLPKMAADGLIS